MKSKDNYVPFSEEWVKEMMKIPKKRIIERFLRPALIHKHALQQPGPRWVKDEVDFLEECIRITKNGGWSTHLVGPMQDRIAKLKQLYFDESPASTPSGEGMAEALTVEHVRELYTSETGEGWMVTPVCHGEKGFASWEYQLWLERKLASLSPGVEDGSGWVKVEDRLPENAGWVNDTVMFWSKKHGHALIGCYDFEFDDWTQQPWTEGAEKLKSSDVTHWRPLPTPPDVEDNQTKKQ